MSYDIRLVQKGTGETVTMPENHFIRGGIYAVEGTKQLCLNITYNYSTVLARVLGDERGIRSLYGQKSYDTLQTLCSAIKKCNRADISDNYWQPAENNVAMALVGLLEMALMAPTGVWQGD